MTLQTGADLGSYTVLGPARRSARHARVDAAARPPRVWRAAPIAGGEPVALITVGPATAPDGEPDTADPGGILRREWALSGSLRHPHLITVHDLLDAGNGPVLVTGWADGGSVTDLLRGPGRLTAGQTVTLLAGVAQALLACHERGLVHGDVSPDTVLVAADGRPMLARVGRTTAAADTGAACPAEPRCASPDVARGRAATAVDDVFAMGATAMQCLLGRPAWPAQDLRDVVIQSEFGQWPTIPPDQGGGHALAALVDAMMSADPSGRPSVREVLDRLVDCPTPEPLTAGPTGTTPPEPAPVGDRGRHARDDAERPTAPPDAAPPLRPVRGGVAADRRWPRLLVAAVALATVAVSAVAVGVWWAGTDRPTTAVLAAAPDPIAPDPNAVDGTTVRGAGVGGTAVDGSVVDWTAVVAALDQRRSAAFAAADPSVLAQVYVADTPALVADRARIEQLVGSGLRVIGLTHEITAVDVVGSAEAGVTVAVTDALPAAAIVDATGVTVGGTAPTAATRRLLTLTAVGDGYRIAALAAA